MYKNKKEILDDLEYENRQSDMKCRPMILDKTICYFCKYSQRPISKCIKWSHELGSCKPAKIVFSETMECPYFERCDKPNVTMEELREVRKKFSGL